MTGAADFDENGVPDLVWHLGAARGVEEREAFGERGEPVPDGGDVEVPAENFGHRAIL